MAERTPYVPSRGRSLLGINGVNADTGAARLFRQAGQLVADIEVANQDYDRSLRVKLLNDSVSAGRVSLAEIESRNKAAPDTATVQSDAYIQAKRTELSSQDSNVASAFEAEMRLNQRTMLIGVRDRWNNDEADKLRASAIQTGQNVISSVNMDSIETPAGQQALGMAYTGFLASLNAKSPYGDPVFSPEERVRADRIFLEGAGDNLMREFIRTSDAADAASIEAALRDGTFEIPFPFGDRTTANVREILPNQIDTYINMAQERQRELERGKATYTAAQYIDSENAFVAMKMDIQAKGGASGASMTPEQIALKFGEGEAGKADYYLFKTAAQANHDGYMATIEQREEMMNDQPVFVAEMMEGAARAQEDIATDGAIYMIQADPAVTEAWENMNRENRPDFQGPKRGAAPYLAALEAGYAARGTPVAQRKIIPKKQAAFLAGALQAPNKDGSLKSNRTIQQELQMIAQQYGPAAGRVMHEIHGEGLSGKYLVVAELPEGIGSKVLDAFDQWPTMETHLKSIGGSSPEALEKLIVSSPRYQRFVATLPTGFKQEADRFRTTAQALAMKYFMDGDETSIEGAYNRAINDTIYSVYAVDGDTRVPKAKYNDAVSAGLSEGSKRKLIDSIKSNIDFSDWTWYGQPITNAEDKKEAIQRLYETGRFVTNSDDSGATLVTQGGNTVKLLNTGEWGMNWEQFGVWGAENKEKIVAPKGQFNPSTGRYDVPPEQDVQFDMSTGKYKKVVR